MTENKDWCEHIKYVEWEFKERDVSIEYKIDFPEKLPGEDIILFDCFVILNPLAPKDIKIVSDFCDYCPICGAKRPG